MREEDCTKIKTEQHYIQLVRAVKSEQEMSVLCWCVLCGCDLFTGVCTCVLYCTLYLVTHSFRTYVSHLFFLHVNQQDVPV